MRKVFIIWKKWCLFHKMMFYLCFIFWKIGLWLLKTFSHWTSHCISTDYIVITAHKRSLRRLCFYRCVSVHGPPWCYPSMHCRWYPSMPCSRGVSSRGVSGSRGVPGRGSPPGQSPWGVLLLGGVDFCCGLLVWWPSVEGGLLLWTSVMDFWFGTFCWRGPCGMVFCRGPEGHTRRPPHQKATTEGCLVETPPDGYCCGRYASYWNGFLLCMKWNENVSQCPKVWTQSLDRRHQSIYTLRLKIWRFQCKMWLNIYV